MGKEKSRRNVGYNIGDEDECPPHDYESCGEDEDYWYDCCTKCGKETRTPKPKKEMDDK